MDSTAKVCMKYVRFCQNEVGRISVTIMLKTVGFIIQKITPTKIKQLTLN